MKKARGMLQLRGWAIKHRNSTRPKRIFFARHVARIECQLHNAEAGSKKYHVIPVRVTSLVNSPTF